MSKILLLIGTISILTAVFANGLGLDRSPGWGRDRWLVLFLGVLCYGVLFFGSALQRFFRAPDRPTYNIANVRTSTVNQAKQQDLWRFAGIISTMAVCMAIAIYSLWYVSAGRFPASPQVNNEYVELGESFLHGQLFLLEKPDPRLVALPDPYDFQQRESIPYHWDASYYQGKYYLYWGPVPALAFAAFEGLTHVPASPSLMVAGAFIGLLIIVLLILFLISRGLFHIGPSVSCILFLAMGFINIPMLFLLGRPQIYETSIIFGQFFLLLGLLGWIIYMDGGRYRWLIVAGLGWGLAIGCRYNLVVSVVIYVAFAVLWIRREGGWNLARASFLFMPLVLCLLGLGAYNFMRFGNPLETGQKYQLTIPVPHQLYFSLAYLPSTAYIYLFYALPLVGKFPFIKSELFDPTLLPSWLSVSPSQVFDHVVFGAIAAAPGLLLLALAIPLFVPVKRESGNSDDPLSQKLQKKTLLGMLISAAAGQFLFLSVFFYSAERYVADFYLSLILAVAMLVWQTDQRLAARHALRITLWMIVAGLTICTVGMGFFGAFGIPPKFFHLFNPSLYAELASYWNDRFSEPLALLGRVLESVVERIH